MTERVKRVATSLRRFRDEVWGDAFPLYLPALVAIGFGTVLCLPMDTFSVGVSWRAMAAIYDSELAWGGLFVILGIAHVAALYTRQPWCWVARACVQASWAFVVGLFAWSSISTGIIAYSAFAVLAFWGRNRVSCR